MNVGVLVQKEKSKLRECNAGKQGMECDACRSKK
jgi:hypothetical protein